jgi:archaeal flagellar protein FlaH
MSKTSLTEELLKFGNAELDRRLGGVPRQSLSLVEGANDSGKTSFIQQIAYGVLSNNLKLFYISTENSPKEIIRNMESLNWDVSRQYVDGSFNITGIDTLGIDWEEEISKYYLVSLTNFLKKRMDRFDFVIIDSVTQLVTHAQPSDVLDFFNFSRSLIEDGKSVALTLHPYAMGADLLTRIRSYCDCQFTLEKKVFRDKNVLTLTINKLKGASHTGGDMLTFEVSPAYGLKILPFTSTRG